MIVFPNCKINLGLHIIRKREDGFHDLETIFYALPLTDALEIIQETGSTKESSISTTGITIDAKPEENICLKAYHLLKKDFDLPAVKIHLHKKIPVGAGLGGGSADGAFTLLLLNKKFNLGISEEKLLAYALELGSDCPFFIKNKPCYALKRGELLKEMELDLNKYKIVVVHPGITVNTGWAFSKITPVENRTAINEIVQLPIENWKDTLVNDFEEVIFKEYPAIQKLKGHLYTAGALYASLSGSGSSVFGIFSKESKLVFDLPGNYLISVL